MATWTPFDLSRPFYMSYATADGTIRHNSTGEPGQETSVGSWYDDGDIYWGRAAGHVPPEEAADDELESLSHLTWVGNDVGWRSVEVDLPEPGPCYCPTCVAS